MASSAPPSPDVPAAFQPYVPASQSPAEFTVRAVVMGVILGVIFSASSVYLALKIGLTVSASIPIAVLAVALFRTLGHSTILENNIVQTTGSAADSVASGVVFTLPAILLMGYDLTVAKVGIIALAGGVLGILMMIPLRKALIVKEHGKLIYPEGTACAEVLIAGEKGGLQARLLFQAFGLAFLYKFLLQGLRLWKEYPTFPKDPSGALYKGGSITAEVSPELLGVGFIIGPRIAGYLFSGGCIAYLVLIPAIKLFGEALTAPLFPSTSTLISQMSPGEVRANYVYYIGAGAVASAGIMALIRSLPTIVGAFRSGFQDLKDTMGGTMSKLRTERDLPIAVTVIGSLALALVLALLPSDLVQVSLLGALLIVIFGFFFAVVSSRICGEIGSSANPISGMTIAALIGTTVIFLLIGWTGIDHRVGAISIAGVIAVCAANAGNTSQDLKTGYLVGSTPRYQQLAILCGTVASAMAIGWTLTLLNKAYTTVVPETHPGVVLEAAGTNDPHRTVTSTGEHQMQDGKTWDVIRVNTPTQNVLAGKYLVDPTSHEIGYVVDPGIGGRIHELNGQAVAKLDSPKATIMALVTDGILTRKLPWTLVLIGVFITAALELMGVSSLPVAVGIYLPISTSSSMFAGGVVRWLVERRMKAEQRSLAEVESGPGVLFASGLIAGGAIAGVVVAAVAAAVSKRADAIGVQPPEYLAHIVGWHAAMGPLAESNLLAVGLFSLLAVALFRVARR